MSSTERISIAIEFKRLNQVVVFHKLLASYPVEAVEAIFNLAQYYLKNECLSGLIKPERHSDIIIMLEFFKYANYKNSKTCFQELYGAHLMNTVLEEIMRFIM